jgi:molecular chaperone DnaK
MGILVNTSIDPTNAVAIGAAYFAGTKEVDQTGSDQPLTASGLKIRASYQKASQELEETFTAKVDGETEGLQYRITSDDGSYDSGLKKLGARIVEDLPLREGSFNIFNLKILDKQGDQVPVNLETIQIAQGRYSVAGQMLPEDFCLVKDDIDAKDTRLELIFSKNSVLPSKTKKTVEIAKTIVKDSPDAITIMIVEGPANRHSSTNKSVGELVISGSKLTTDLLSGTEVDLRFEISESRDLTVSAFLNGTGQEFSQVFTPKTRTVSTRILASEILLLETKVQGEIADANMGGDRESGEDLKKVLQGIQDLILSAADIAEDDVTDKRYQLEDNKRRLAQQMFELTAGKRLNLAKAAYST